MKRFLCCLICLLLMTSVNVAALADTLEEPHADPNTLILPVNHELPLTEEPVTVSVLFPRSNGHPDDLNDNWYVNNLAEKTGIRLEIIPVEESGWTEKKNLVLASGDYSEIFMGGLTWDDALVYGEPVSYTHLIPPSLRPKAA